MSTHTLEQAKSTRTYHDGTPVPLHRIDNAQPRDWREEVKASRYKYPLKAPRCRHPAYTKLYYRKVFRQQMRLLDREIEESEPSETFTYTVAKVKTGHLEDWHFYEIAPDAEPTNSPFNNDVRYWHGFDRSGPVFFHVRGPDSFGLVLKLTAEGLESPTASALNTMPDEVWATLQKRAEKIANYKGKQYRIKPDVTRRFPTYGPSEEGQSLAMQLQADYGLRADNMLEED